MPFGKKMLEKSDLLGLTLETDNDLQINYRISVMMLSYFRIL